ncbi:hypothetical protein [Granulicella arctica]|uniref:hypothetical protein n=1 Tax=Granulicella arctica TaxID=940613 RepID=UPI0021E0E82E|nr:hypothetical protein [Granulicella arctica]
MTMRQTLHLLLVGFAVTSAGKIRAQDASSPPVAPIPQAFQAAKTVFISNAGADSGLFPHPFNGDPDRPYNEFYAAIRAWGRYAIVSDPSQADIVFELQLSAPNGPANADKTKGASDPLPMFRLVILDRRSHYILWALTESILPANLQKTHDRNFDDAITTIAEDVKRLAAAKP